MDERLKILVNDDKLLPVISLFEEQATLDIPVSGRAKLQGRLIQPKFSLKQWENNQTRQQDLPEQRRETYISLATEKIVTAAEDNRRVQICRETWRPGTFGFSNCDDEWNVTSVPLLPASFDSAEVVNSDSAPNARKSGRTAIIQVISWAIPIPLIFPMTALLTRYLGPVQYGEYSFTLTYLIILSLLTCTGMDSLIVRQLSRQPRIEWSQTLSYATGTRLVSTLLSIGAGALLVLVLPMSTEQRNLLLVGSISLFFSFSVNGLRMIYSHGFRAEQRMGILFLIQTIDRVMTAGLVALVVLLHLSLLWACILIMYSDLPFFIIQVIIARKRFNMRLRFNLARARDLLLSSLPLMGYDMLSFISGQADLLLLMLLSGPQNVGLYALASRITDPLVSIVLAYMLGLYPLLCAKFEKEREQFVLIYQQSARILALCIIPLAIFVSIEAGIIVALLGGQRFSTAAIALQLLIWAMAATFFNQLAASVCMAANMDQRISYVTTVSTVGNILLNLSLIPLWGIVGAGLAALVSEFLGLCLFLFILRDIVPLFHTFGIVLRVLLGNMPALAFLLWQQGRSLLLTIPIALFLTVGGCVATRTFTRNDLFMARGILFHKPGKEPSKETSIDIADWPTSVLSSIQI